MADMEKGHTTNVANSTTGYRSTPTARRLGNPGTLGLFSFASTTLILSLFNVQARGVKAPNVVVGMALFCGGLTQLLAGMWEFPNGNTFGATAFSSYGAFWLSYATLLIPGSGITDAYATGPATQEDNAIGIFLMTWMTVTFLFFVASLRKNIGFIALFFFLTLTFMMLGASKFTGITALDTAGGAFGIITALIAYYVGMSELLASEVRAVAGLPIGAFKHD